MVKLPTVAEANDAIKYVCEEFAKFLEGKNISYNGSAFTPLTYNGKTIDLEDAIDVRVVDKIRRMLANKSYGSEDTEGDLLGYLLIKKAVKKLKEQGYYQTPAEVELPVADIAQSEQKAPARPFNTREELNKYIVRFYSNYGTKLSHLVVNYEEANQLAADGVCFYGDRGEVLTALGTVTLIVKGWPGSQDKPSA